MNKILKEKISESVSSVLPITIIVLLLSVTITPMPVGTMVLFLTGAALLIVGMALFSLGTDVSMTPMGEGIGAQLPRTKNLFIVILDYASLSACSSRSRNRICRCWPVRCPSIPNNVLIWTVAVGVGLFFVLAMLRTLFKIRLSLLLIVFYVGGVCPVGFRAERVRFCGVRLGRRDHRPGHRTVHHGARCRS